MASNLEYLRRVGLFENMRDDQIQKLAGVCRRRACDKGELLFFEGDPGHSLFIIVSGRIRIERSGGAGETTVLAMRHPGEVIGEMALVDGEPRSAQAVSQTKSKLLVLQAEDFRNQVLSDPDMCFSIMKTMSRRLREAADTALSMRTMQVHEHLLTYLLGHADQDGFVKLEVSQSTLADTIGCSREAINRAFQRLVRDGSIIRRKRDLIELVRKD